MSAAIAEDGTPPASAEQQPPAVDALLRCKTDNVRLITKLLGSICFKERQAPLSGPLAWCQLSAQGLRFTTEESTSLQARVYITAEMFREYEYAEEEDTFIGLNLGVMLECLRILDHKGGALSQPPSLFVEYREETESLRLRLIEGIALTTCEIATLDNGRPTEHSAASVQRACRIVMRADILREGLAELEWGDTNQRDKVVVLSVSASERTLKLTVRNSDCGCEMAFPPDTLSRIECEDDVRESYRYGHLHAVARALALAEEACLRVMGDGGLSVMLRMSDGQKTGYTEYTLLPLADEEDGGFG
jgi:hypothetical protein